MMMKTVFLWVLFIPGYLFAQITITEPSEKTTFPFDQESVWIKGEVDKFYDGEISIDTTKVKIEKHEESSWIFWTEEKYIFSYTYKLNFGKNEVKISIPNQNIQKTLTIFREAPISLSIVPERVVVFVNFPISFDIYINKGGKREKVVDKDINIYAKDCLWDKGKLVIKGETNGAVEVEFSYLPYKNISKKVFVRTIPKLDNMGASIEQLKLLAEEEASLDAKIQIAEYIYGVGIQSSTQTKDFIAKKDEILAKVSGYLIGVKLGRAKWIGEKVEVSATVDRVSLERIVEKAFSENLELIKLIKSKLGSELTRTGEAAIVYK